MLQDQMRTNHMARRLTALALLALMLMPFLLPTLGHAAGTPETEKAGVMVVGMEANYAPYNWSQTTETDGAYPIANSAGEYANGYDVQMAKRVAESLGLTLEIQKIEWDGLLPALLSGKIDAIIAGMSPTPERKEQIDFTSTYYTADLVLVMRKDSKFASAQSLQDFTDAKISGQLNTFLYTAVDQIPNIQKQEAADTISTLISAVKAEKMDAFVAERPTALSTTAAHPDMTFVGFEAGKGFRTDPSDVELAIGVRKGSQLGPRITEALSQISEETRADIMENMIQLNTVGAVPQTFWQSVLSIAEEYGPLFLRGAGVTLLIAVFATVVGFLLGLVIQVIRSTPIDKKGSKAKGVALGVVKWLLTAYVEILRGTPMMVQSVLFYYGSKLFFGIDMSPMVAALLVVSINTSAYLAEVIRGGIDSVDSAQMEASQAIGLTHGQAMRFVILPQTVRAIIPSIGNELITNIKDTSVLNVISVTELFFVTRSVAGSTFQIFQAYLITCVIYFVLTFAASRIVNWIGRRATSVKPFELAEQEVGGQA